MARKGRGRLSSIDKLPAEADPIVAWAFQELKDRDRTQVEIHEEFNQRLAAVGAGPISMSAFNRHSINIAAIARRHEETRRITSALVERLKPGEVDDLTIITGEAIKTLVFELMNNGEDVDPKGAMELARALQATVNAQNKSMDRKRAELAKFEAQVDDALDTIVQEGGLSKDRANDMRSKLLGLRT